MLYSLTITKNTRTSFEVDKIVIEGLLDALYQQHYECGYIGWELTTHKPHLLHIHTTLSGPRMPYMNKFKEYMKTHALNAKVKTLRKVEDVERWVAYCHKQDDRIETIHDAYEESSQIPFTIPVVPIDGSIGNTGVA